MANVEVTTGHSKAEIKFYIRLNYNNIIVKYFEKKCKCNLALCDRYTTQVGTYL